MEEKIKLTIGVFVILAVIGTTYYIAKGDTAYYCEERNIIGICFKLSNPVNDISTRCYYNESSPAQYKICNKGWILFKEPEFIGISKTEKEKAFEEYTISKELIQIKIVNMSYNLISDKCYFYYEEPICNICFRYDNSDYCEQIDELATDKDIELIIENRIKSIITKSRTSSEYPRKQIS